MIGNNVQQKSALKNNENQQTAAVGNAKAARDQAMQQIQALIKNSPSPFAGQHVQGPTANYGAGALGNTSAGVSPFTSSIMGGAGGGRPGGQQGGLQQMIQQFQQGQGGGGGLRQPMASGHASEVGMPPRTAQLSQNESLPLPLAPPQMQPPQGQPPVGMAGQIMRRLMAQQPQQGGLGGQPPHFGNPGMPY